ncbi:MAG: hypothetical protein CND37_05705 [Bacteroidetes bacterium MED-G20]|nr:MAG: hypothetical protein CND37_05705 [Bacteroidetes bacterium MED-G20]
MKKTTFILFLVWVLAPIILEAQFYNRNTYRTQRNEVSFGLGASSCLTDVGGGKDIKESLFGDYARGFLWDINADQTKYVANFSYKYYLKSKIGLKINMVYSKVSGNDESTTDKHRRARNLNFETTIIEGSAVFEWTIIPEKSGSRYNLKNKFGKSIGAKNPLGFGLYAFGGIGGFYYNPFGYNNFGSAKTKFELRPLRTEGQGLKAPNDAFYANDVERGINYQDYAFPKSNAGDGTYGKFAICTPVGFGIKKSFHGTAGIMLEAGFRFTNTDYLDDVSTRYFSPSALDLWNTNSALISGVNQSLDENGTFVGYLRIGDTPPDFPELGIIEYNQITNPELLAAYGSGYSEVIFWQNSQGQIRGNPKNLDSYMFVTLSAYKKLKNTQKSFKIANSGFKRRIKASF